MTERKGNRKTNRRKITNWVDIIKRSLKNEKKELGGWGEAEKRGWGGGSLMIESQVQVRSRVFDASFTRFEPLNLVSRRSSEVEGQEVLYLGSLWFSRKFVF